MGEALRWQPMSVEAFYAFVVTQDRRYELVDGEPVLMAGANRRHDRIVANAIRVLGNQLVGHRCSTFTSDTYIRIPSGNRRQPDLGVDCGTMDDESLDAAEPTLVVEVLSPSTRMFDRTDKLEEYKTVPSLEYILLVDPDLPQVRLYLRATDRTWTTSRQAGLEAVVEMKLFGVHLPLAELYAGLAFRPRPTNVE